MLAWYDKSQRPQYYRCPEAHGGPYRMGVNSAYNTVEGNVGAYNTVCVRVFCRVLFLQVHRVWSLVSWFDLRALACFLRLPLASSERASLVGWPQSALIAPVREER